jgi:hypothetical protein
MLFTCKKCGETRPAEGYYTKDAGQRRDTTCKTCRKQKRAERHRVAKEAKGITVGRTYDRCQKRKCINPRQGQLTPDDYHMAAASYVKKDGTQSTNRARICKVCKSQIDRRAYAEKRRALEKDERIQKEKSIVYVVDWSEFSHLAWDVRAANDYLRGRLVA